MTYLVVGFSAIGRVLNELERQTDPTDPVGVPGSNKREVGNMELLKAPFPPR